MDVALDEIVAKAKELGFDDAKVTEPTVPEEDILAYFSWLDEGLQADLHYMENKIRVEPKNLLPGAKSAIFFASYYKQPKEDFKPGIGVIASYARGKDYHNIHRKRLKQFIFWLDTKTLNTASFKAFSDSTPILEKALAQKAGLGFMGKNTLLIHRKLGTFFLLSGILTTLDLPKSVSLPRMPRCGSCNRCIDACPTGALKPYKLDAAKCLSNILIESDGPVSETIKSKNPGYVFGCDICQDVCPHNARKKPSTHPDFSGESGFGSYLDEDTLSKIENNPELLFGTPLKRRGFKGLRENAKSLPWKLESNEGLNP
ncbi:tRNA epoxyqueuosine(34) reductase QueG [Criblamydia sequanensis]|uniref:4Fe-4S ferredoxin-type domain-containing protein n=1 Tax=Candidatus Criblamydia sequanensis CRIB-18 TaxID=1437425 RepID=A0A090D236_9BACT|nr:tRNA epoxyqueuosine(34) reductase QueG [Criblamydia sequanensis]CDR34038.1 Conserved hypothetical protein [Criblamydia sequanensis CRIB-18]